MSESHDEMTPESVKKRVDMLKPVMGDICEMAGLVIAKGIDPRSAFSIVGALVSGNLGNRHGGH